MARAPVRHLRLVDRYISMPPERLGRALGRDLGTRDHITEGLHVDRLSTLLQVVGLVMVGGGLFLAPAWVAWIGLGVIVAAVGTVLELDEE